MLAVSAYKHLASKAVLALHPVGLLQGSLLQDHGSHRGHSPLQLPGQSSGSGSVPGAAHRPRWYRQNLRGPECPAGVK